MAGSMRTFVAETGQTDGGEKGVKMIFPDHGVNRKVVDNVENYLNMKFQPKLMKRSRENGQKP